MPFLALSLMALMGLQLTTTAGAAYGQDRQLAPPGGQTESRDTGSSAQINKDLPLKLSAKNQCQGTIIKILEGRAMAEISVKVGELEMVAAIAKSSVQTLGLKVNDPVMVVVKSTDLVIGK